MMDITKRRLKLAMLAFRLTLPLVMVAIPLLPTSLSSLGSLSAMSGDILLRKNNVLSIAVLNFCKTCFNEVSSEQWYQTSELCSHIFKNGSTMNTVPDMKKSADCVVR